MLTACPDGLPVLQGVDLKGIIKSKGGGNMDK